MPMLPPGFQTVHEVAHCYQIHNVIGKGGFSTVILASSQENKKRRPIPVTLKAVQRAGLREGTASKRRFDLERHILQDLSVQCSHIIQLRDIHDTPDVSFLVTDYYVGGSLAFHLRKARRRAREQNSLNRTIGEARIKFYTLELIFALSFLHMQGVMHRDLKPSNILIDAAGYARLADFGTCSDLRCDIDAAHDRDIRRLSTRIGTTDYMAPEMLRGQPYGKSVDFWSMGVLLYELLYARLPVTDPSDDVIVAKITSTKDFVIPDSDLVSADAKDFLASLLRKDPNKRLGCAVQGSRRLLAHQWFGDMREHFTAIDERSYPAPWLPDVDSTGFDLRYMNPKHTESQYALTPKHVTPVPFSNERDGAGKPRRTLIQTRNSSTNSIASPRMSTARSGFSGSLSRATGSKKSNSIAAPPSPVRRNGSALASTGQGRKLAGSLEPTEDGQSLPPAPASGFEDFGYYLCCGPGGGGVDFGSFSSTPGSGGGQQGSDISWLFGTSTRDPRRADGW